MNLWVEARQGESPPYNIWWPWASASEEIKCLLCPVTSLNQVTERSIYFVSQGSSGYVNNLPNFVDIGIVVVKI